MASEVSTAYCVKCKQKQSFKNPTVKETANGRKMLQGECSVCGTKVNVFLKADGPPKEKPAGEKTKRSRKKADKADA